MDVDLGKVPDAWQFMLPWCENLRDRVGYTYGSPRDPPDQFVRGLKIYPPRKSSTSQLDEEFEREYAQQRQKLRETLALLVVVARANNDVWRRLLVHAKVLNYKISVLELLDGELPARFWIQRPFGRDISHDDYDNLVRGIFVQGIDADAALNGDLVQFCGVGQHTKYSKEYKATLTQIVDLWRENQSKPGDIPEEIEVPMTVYIEPMSMRSPGAVVKYVQNVIRAIRHIRDSSWKKMTARTTCPRVTFVLESVLGDLRPIQIRSELAALMEDLTREGIRCSGLSFRQQIGNALAAPAKRGGARKAIGKLLTNVFGGAASAGRIALDTRCGIAAKPMTGPRFSKTDVVDYIQLGSVNFHCEPSRCWFFERMCSAAAANQSTSNLSIVMQEDGNAELFRWRWQWVCYGFFSRRARRYSRLENLTLRDVRIIAQDVEAMRAVLASDNPEEDLLGLVPSQQQGGDVNIKANASIRLQPMDATEDLGNNSNFKVGRKLRGVKLLNNSVDDGWVDVLIPGFGKCQTRRAALVHNEGAPLPADTSGISSLVVAFCEDPEHEVLLRFLELIGGELKYLTLQLSSFNTSDLTEVATICPNLVDIVVCTPGVEARFRARDFQQGQGLVALTGDPVAFEDVTAIVRLLCVPGTPFADSTRRLRVRTRRDYERRASVPPLDELCVTLLLMLRLNHSLEYLDVVSNELNLAFMMLLKAQHLEKLAAVGEALPIESKLAFISVMDSQHPTKVTKKARRTRSSTTSLCLHDLDRNVVDLIFTFAAKPATRKVYFRIGQEFEGRCDYLPV